MSWINENYVRNENFKKAKQDLLNLINSEAWQKLKNDPQVSITITNIKALVEKADILYTAAKSNEEKDLVIQELKNTSILLQDPNMKNIINYISQANKFSGAPSIARQSFGAAMITLGFGLIFVPIIIAALLGNPVLPLALVVPAVIIGTLAIGMGVIMGVGNANNAKKSMSNIMLKTAENIDQDAYKKATSFSSVTSFFGDSGREKAALPQSTLLQYNS